MLGKDVTWLGNFEEPDMIELTTDERIACRELIDQENQKMVDNERKLMMYHILYYGVILSILR